MAQSLTFPAINPFLLMGGFLSYMAALLHIACIVGGTHWLRFFGAGEKMVHLANSGSSYPGLITGFIAIALIVLGTYAWVGGAGGVMSLPLPFVKWILLMLTIVFLIRGAALIPLYFIMPDELNAFAIWSSLAVLGMGVIHAIGLLQVWKSI